MSEFPLTRLPSELLEMVLACLPFVDQCCLRRVCRDWNIILHSQRIFHHITLSEELALTDGRQATGGFHVSLEEIAPAVRSVKIQLCPANKDGKINSLPYLLCCFKGPEMTLRQVTLKEGNVWFSVLLESLPKSVRRLRFLDVTFLDRIIEPESRGCIEVTYTGVRVSAWQVDMPDNGDHKRMAEIHREFLRMARVAHQQRYQHNL